jgi:ribonucleoside-diphosphate reductase alpha chain
MPDPGRERREMVAALEKKAVGGRGQAPGESGSGANGGGAHGGSTLLPRCPKCSQPSLIRQEGCDLCTSCGYSKCS